MSPLIYRPRPIVPALAVQGCCLHYPSLIPLVFVFIVVSDRPISLISFIGRMSHSRSTSLLCTWGVCGISLSCVVKRRTNGAE